MSFRAIICASSLPKAQRQGSVPCLSPLLFPPPFHHSQPTHHTDPSPDPPHLHATKHVTATSTPLASASTNLTVCSSFIDATLDSRSAWQDDVYYAAYGNPNAAQAVGFALSSGCQGGSPPNLGHLIHGERNFHSSAVSLNKSPSKPPWRADTVPPPTPRSRSWPRLL